MSSYKQIKGAHNAGKRERRNKPPRPFERKSCLSRRKYTKLGAILAASKHGGGIRRCGFCGGWHHTRER